MVSRFPREAQQGQGITAGYINQIVQAVLKSVIGGTGINVRRSGNQLVINADDRSGRGGTSTTTVIRKAVITTIGTDYLDCNFYYPSTAVTGEQVYVAKPEIFQPSYYDGETIDYNGGDEVTYAYTTERYRTATLTGGSGAEEQYLTPDYYVGEVITVINVETDVLDANSNYCVWQDMGIGKGWAAP